MESTYNYRTFGGTAPNPPTGTYVPNDWATIPEYAFGTGTKILYIYTHDNRAVYRLSFSEGVWGDDFILYDAPQAEPFYISAQKFQVQNYINGSLAVWQVIGSW